MSLADVLPSLKTLNRAEKLRVVKILIDEIADEEAAFFENGAQYEVWSPYEAYDAAAKLRELLEERKQNA